MSTSFGPGLIGISQRGLDTIEGILVTSVFQRLECSSYLAEVYLYACLTILEIDGPCYLVSVPINGMMGVTGGSV